MYNCVLGVTYLFIILYIMSNNLTISTSERETPVTKKRDVSSPLYDSVDTYKKYKQHGECDFGWLVGFGFNGPLRQYFSLYRAVTQREGEGGTKG